MFIIYLSVYVLKNPLMFEAYEKSNILLLIDQNFQIEKYVKQFLGEVRQGLREPDSIDVLLKPAFYSPKIKNYIRFSL